MSVPMIIPRNTRFSGRTWLTTILAPIIALVVTYLLTVVSLALLPSLTDLAGQEGLPDEVDEIGTMLLDNLQANVPTVWESAFLMLVTALATPIAMTMTMGMNYPFGGIPEEQVSVEATLWAMPLMLTVIIALVIAWAHRREGRKIRNSQPMVWLPALVTGAVTAVAGLLLALPNIIDVSLNDFSLTESLGSEIPGDTENFDIALDLSLVVSSNAAMALAGGFVIGFAAAAIGRLASAPAKRDTYHLSSIPTLGPTAVQAIRVTLGTLLAITLVSGIYLTAYALFKLEDVPASILFAVFPYFVNVGIVGVIGALGGSGSAIISEGQGMSETDSGILFTDAPWNVQVPMVLLIVLIVGLAGIWWARTRDPRFERNFLGHCFVPVSFLVAGTLTIVANRLAMSASAKFGPDSESISATVQLSWLSILWFTAMGVLIELIATVSRPSGHPAPIYPPAPAYPVGQAYPGYPGGPGYPAPQAPVQTQAQAPAQGPIQSQVPVQPPAQQAPMPPNQTQVQPAQPDQTTDRNPEDPSHE